MTSGSEVQPLLSQNPNEVTPKVKRQVYWFMVAFGLASLLPWNMVITATGYFQVKFAETNNTIIETRFPSYFQIGGIGSNVAMSLSSMVIMKYVQKTRLCMATNALSLAIFVVMTIMAKLNTVAWSMGFFVATNIMFCVSCGASAAYISGMTATASMLTAESVRGFYLGQGSAGLFATTISIITLSIPGTDPVAAGFYYFLISCIVLVASLVAYSLFIKMDYVISSTQVSKSGGGEPAIDEKSHSPWQLFSKVWTYLASSLITLLITLMCFPAALSALRSTQDSDSSWNKIYFTPVITFLLFNIGDVAGRASSSLIQLPSKRWILPISVLRAVFIPLIFMCNLQPRSITVWFPHDALPAIFNFLMAWSNGHVLSLAASYAPEVVATKTDRSMIGTFSAFSSALGLVIGSLLVFPMMSILQI